MWKLHLAIVFFLIPAFTFANAWSQKVVKTHNQTKLAELCKKVSKRIQTKVCKSIKKEDLEASDKMKWAFEDKKTIRLKYKTATVRLRATDEPGTFLVNRKSLYLEEVESDKDLSKKLTKLLGEENLAALNPVLLFLFHNSEHQTCFESDQSLKNCALVSQFERATFDKKSSQKTMDQGLKSFENFKSSINYLSPARALALNQCQCEKGLCGMDASQTTKPYDQCTKSIKKLKKQTKDVAGFTQYSEQVLSLSTKGK